MEEKSKTKIQPLAKNRHTDDLIDHYWGSINYIANLIKASEIKAGLILTFYGILLNFIYKNLPTVIDTIENPIGFYIMLGFWFLCIAASIYYSIRCFMPRIENDYDKSIFFFGDVISSYGDIREFSKTFYEISLDADQLFPQLGQQIYINSKIAEVKFKNIKKSVQFLAIGLVFMTLLSIYYGIDTLI